MFLASSALLRLVVGLVAPGAPRDLDCVAAEASAKLVLADPAGVQEETTALGVPRLTMRDLTERPITITEGTNVPVGRDLVRIVSKALRGLMGGVVPRRPALLGRKGGGADCRGHRG